VDGPIRTSTDDDILFATLELNVGFASLSTGSVVRLQGVTPPVIPLPRRQPRNEEMAGWNPFEEDADPYPVQQPGEPAAHYNARVLAWMQRHLGASLEARTAPVPGPVTSCVYRVCGLREWSGRSEVLSAG
jgi:hypothetical protein